MERSLVLSIIGISISAGFGFWGIYLTLKKRKYPGELTYYLENYIGLFDEIAENLKDLSILYNQQPIKSNLVLIKGHIINTGSKDIDPSMVNKKLTAKLPENFKWIDANILISSQEVYASTKIEKYNILTIDLGFFRCKECITFQALVEVPIIDKNTEKASSKLIKSLTWDHRIIDTAKVKSKSFLEVKEKKPLENIIPLIVSIFLLLLPFLIYFNILPQTPNIYYEISSNQSPPLLVKLKPEKNNIVSLIGIDSDYKEKIRIDEIKNKYRINIVLKYDNIIEIQGFIFLSLLFICGLFMFISIVLQIRKSLQLKQILNT